MQAGAQLAIRDQMFPELQRYFEIDRTLDLDPTNKALKREKKELQKYFDLMKTIGERRLRHEAARQRREALDRETKEERRKSPRKNTTESDN